jgi:hypothetical protein
MPQNFFPPPAQNAFNAVTRTEMAAREMRFPAIRGEWRGDRIAARRHQLPRAPGNVSLIPQNLTSIKN